MTAADDLGPGAPVADAAALERALLAHHGRFLAFLERRLGRRADAEEVLQGAYLKALEKGLPEAGDEAAVAWFHRVLRSALVDRVRRTGTEQRAATRLAAELEAGSEPELRAALCACLEDALPALRPEYAEVVREVDLAARPLAEVAARRGITVNNATVRLHRARQALRRGLERLCGACAAHGCLDCACRSASRAGPAPHR